MSMPLAPDTPIPPFLRPAHTWGDESDSSLTSLDESEDELEDDEPPPPPPQRNQRARPQPAEESATLHPSTSRHGRTTRQATQKLAEEDLGGINDKDLGELPPYFQTPTKVSDAYEWMKEDLVDINPDYQRDVVWNESKQMNLIDSLFQNYPVPNLVFVRRFEKGEFYRVCIDGKQRLTSIRRFIDGEIPWKNPTTKKKYWFRKTQPNQRRAILPEWMQKMFKRKDLTIYDYEGITRNQERMIFQRVQLGTVLTPAERLQAVNGIMATLVREVRDHVCGLSVFASFSEWGGNRGRDFLALAQIIFLVKSGKLPQTLPEPDKLTPFLEGKVGDMNKLREGVKQSFNIFARLLSHSTYGPILSEKEISPVEFVIAVYAISSLKKQLSDSDLADALKKIWGNARDKSTVKRKATKSSASKSYLDMRSFFERVRDGKVVLEGDKREKVKAADVLWNRGLEAGAESQEAPMEDVRPTTSSRKRPRSQVDSSAADFDDDEVPLSNVKTERKVPASKKAKLTQRAKREIVEPDDDMDSDGSAEIVACVPKRAATSGSSARKPSQVGPRPTSSAAATRVKRPLSTKREAPSSTPAVPPPPAKASTSTTTAGPSMGACAKPSASRSSSVQSFSTANQGNTPGPSSVPAGRLSQPRSTKTTPSMGTVALPPDTSHVGGGNSNPNPRMERLQNLKQMSRPDSSSATPPLQYPPLSASSIKLPTPPKDSPAPEEPRIYDQSVSRPRFPPGRSASTSAAAPSSTATGSADSVLGSLRAKGSNLTSLKFSKTPSEAKMELPTPPLPTRVPAGLASAGQASASSPSFGHPPPNNWPPPSSARSTYPPFPSNPTAFALGRTPDPRVLPTPPASANMSRDAN